MAHHRNSEITGTTVRATARVSGPASQFGTLGSHSRSPSKRRKSRSVVHSRAPSSGANAARAASVTSGLLT